MLNHALTPRSERADTETVLDLGEADWSDAPSPHDPKERILKRYASEVVASAQEPSPHDPKERILKHYAGHTGVVVGLSPHPTIRKSGY